MKIVVVGAAGEVGQWVSRDLAASAGVEVVVLADLDRDRLGSVLEGWPVNGDLRELAVTRDSSDPLRAELDDADVLMDCSSFGGSGMLDLAIETKTGYADLISSRDPSDAERAKQAGIAAVSGLGQSPGMSNVMANHANRDFDLLDEFHVYWVSFRAAAASRGGLDTITWELGNDCPERELYLNGRWVPAGFMEASKLVEFVGSIGKQRVYAVPHPEVRDLVASFPSLRFCSVLGAWPKDVMEEFRVLNEYGLLEADSVEDTKRHIWKYRGGQRRGELGLTAGVVFEARGVLDGVPTARRYDVIFPDDWADTGISRGTGVCAGVGAELIGRHGATGGGFVPGEVFFDPDQFLEALRARGLGYDVVWNDRNVSDEFEMEER